MTILSQLRNASWRGVEFPFTGSRDFSFQQEQAQHRFIFRDQQLIESLGRQNPTFRYTIPFRENIRRPPWRNLFTVVYPQFLEACIDRTAGVLIDPVHGETRAKCVSLSESLSTGATDGVEVVAEFVFAPESPDDSTTQFANIAKPLEGAAASAVEFGAAVGALSDAERAKVASLNQPSSRADVSVLNAARAAVGFVQRTKTQTRAQLQEASAQMEVTRKEIEEAKDPELEPLRRDASRNALASKRLAQSAGEPVIPFTTIRPLEEIGRMAFAVKHGVSIDRLLEFNPFLADLILIPAGTRVKVPRTDG
jgi:hypothetical protein